MLPVVVIVLEPAAMIPMILPPVMLPEPVSCPVPKPKLPTLALPVVVIALLPAAMVPMMLPPVMLPEPVNWPAPKPKLPTFAFPVTVIAVTFAFVAPILPTIAFPVTLSVPRAPTLVKLEVTTVPLRTVPVNVAALAVIATLDAAVNCPC